MVLTESLGNATSVKLAPALAGPALPKPDACEQSVILGLGDGSAVGVVSAGCSAAVGDPVAPAVAPVVADELHALRSRASASRIAEMIA